jgi:catechol 2,3-dioxygenase-like lactoylglutathione lyase family enzyme
MISRRAAVNWLWCVLVIVFAYALGLVVAGGTAHSIFSWFGFGPDAAIDTPPVRDYLRLPYMVLGAVMAGWTLLLIRLVRGPLRDGSRWAWRFIVESLVLWFTLDTGMSIVLGYPTHALFNVPFAIALGIPLSVLRGNTTHDGRTNSVAQRLETVDMPRMRIARPTVDINRAITFWTKVVGLDLLSQFKDHAGYDGVIFGHPRGSWELELTRHSSGAPLPAPTDEDIVALYLKRKLADAVTTRLVAEGHSPYEHPNPYWKTMGASVHTDPDGYTLIVFPID